MAYGIDNTLADLGESAIINDKIKVVIRISNENLRVNNGVAIEINPVTNAIVNNIPVFIPTPE